MSSCGQEASVAHQGQVKPLCYVTARSDLTSSLTSSTHCRGEGWSGQQWGRPGGMLSESGGGEELPALFGLPKCQNKPLAWWVFFPSSDPILPHGCHFFFLFLSFSELLGRSKSREVGRSIFFFHTSPQNYSSQTIQ